MAYAAKGYLKKKKNNNNNNEITFDSMLYNLGKTVIFFKYLR